MRWVSRLWLLGVAWTACGWAAGEPGAELFADPARTKPAPTFELRKVRISDTPECRKGDCSAARMLRQGLRPSRDVPRALGAGGKNPSSLLCVALPGRPAVYYRPNGDEVSVCEFSDGSFALAWDLFRALK